MARINLVYDASLHHAGIAKYILWDFEKFPHIVIFGATGSGKTYLLKILLARIGKYVPRAELVVCDYKSDTDFTFLKGCSNFYRYTECHIGLERAVRELQNRQANETASRHFFCLIFDEWASFVSNMEKKSAEQAKQDLATLLMLGRSFNVHVIVSQQRLDAAYFNSARDNFSVVIGMGTLSKEAIQMMFSEYKDVINSRKSQGSGSMIIGSEFKEIIVPQVRDVLTMQTYIRSATNPRED